MVTWLSAIFKIVVLNKVEELKKGRNSFNYTNMLNLLTPLMTVA